MSLTRDQLLHSDIQGTRDYLVQLAGLETRRGVTRPLRQATKALTAALDWINEHGSV